MRVFKKVLAGLLITPLLLFFLILTTITFQILNPSYLFPSLERNGAYEKILRLLAESLPNDPNIPKEEREAYAKIVGSIKTQTTKRIVEENLSQVLNFLHGKSNDIKILIPAQEIGILGTKDINWSLAKNPSVQAALKTNLFFGVWNKLLLAWLVILLVIAVLFLIGGKIIIFIEGVIVILFSVLAKIYLFILATTLPSHGEPSQRLLSFLASTLLAEITTVWLVIGVILIIIWIFLKKKNLLS